MGYEDDAGWVNEFAIGAKFKAGSHERPVQR